MTATLYFPGFLSVLLLAVAVPAQALTFAEGTPTSLRIASVPENDPTAADTVILQDAELLPIEMTGRTLAHELDVTRSRRIERNGVVRLELPGGGRLLRYRRAAATFHGLLHVAPDGTARVVFETPGVGTSGIGDPFRSRVAIADDALHAAVALTNGDLHVVRLDGAVYPSTGRADFRVGAGLAPIAESMMIGPSRLWYLATGGAGGAQRLWRVSLADGSVPADVSPPPVANGEFKDELVMSRDGARVVCLYGLHHLQRLWHVGLTGPATVLPPLADKYEDPGYLPDEPGEPAMLLNDDGTRLFYVDSEPRDELWMLDTTGQLPPLEITSDANFQPYIGMHILPKFAANALLVAIGDPQQMDWFRATLQPGGGVVQNLTGTGSVVTPFPAGTIDPINAADVGGKLLVVEQGVGTGAPTLRRVDPVLGTAPTIATNVTGLPAVGGTTGGAADLLVRTSAGDRLFSAADTSLLVALPPELQLTPPVRGPQFQGTFLHLPIGWGMPVFWAAFGAVELPIEFGLQQIAMTAQGGVVLVGGSVRYLALGTYQTLARPTVPFRVCLSGAGG